MIKALLLGLALALALPAAAQSPALSNVAKLNAIRVATDPAYAGGMKCDGTTDDAAALQAAVTASANAVLQLPKMPSTCRVRSMVTIASPVTILGGGSTILFDFPVGTSNANGALFKVNASDVTFDGIKVDATGITGTITSVNRYAILMDPSGATRYTDLVVRNSRFTNLTQISGTIPATTTVMHAIYLRQADRARVEGNYFGNISGAGVITFSTNYLKVSRNDFDKIGWGNVFLNNNNLNWSISDNRFYGSTLANPVYWGGGIEVMGQTSDQVSPGSPDKQGTIHNNQFIGGFYRYGSVLRLASAHNVDVSGNIFDQPDVDQVPTFHQDILLITVRDVTLNNGPSKNISIRGNKFIAKGTGTQKAIHVIGTSGSGTNTTPHEGITVDGNQFAAPDASNYYGTIFYLLGATAGAKDIVFANNIVKVQPAPVPASGIATSGTIILDTNVGTLIENVQVVGNNFEYFNGVGSTNNHALVNANDRVSRVTIEGNVIKNFARTLILSATNAEQFYYPVNNVYVQPGGTNAISFRGISFNPIPNSCADGTATYDPGNLVDGAGVTTTVGVLGAVLGDLVTVSFSLDLQGITFTGYVSAAGTVSVRFQNETGGALDLASGTIRARVCKV